MERQIDKALYYERVSTTHEEQANSLENQRDMCEKYLKRHPEIQLAEPIDRYSEQISGKSDERPKYQEMMKRVERGDISYIMVKDLKRISRSSEVSAQLKNTAKKYGFKFILLSTGSVYDPNANDTRLMYGFESLLAEETVYRQSEYGHIAHRQKCENRRLNRNNVTFGYRWDNDKKDIVVDDERAAIIQTMFDMYVFQDSGIQEIRKYLAVNDLHYSAKTVSKWLMETAYIGVFHINKMGSELGVGSGQKTKRFRNPKDEWVPVERPDLAIIDKEIFDLAQKIRESRQHYYEADKNGVSQGRFRGSHLFSAKVFCGECGYPYVHNYADRKQTIGIYKDSFSMRRKNALEKCENKDFYRIYEDDLKEIVATAINGLVQNHTECFDLLLSVVGEVLTDESSYNKHLTAKEAELKKLSKKAEKTKAAYIEAPGSLKAALAEDYEKIVNCITEVEGEIKRMKENLTDKEGIKEQLIKISEVIDTWKVIGTDMLDRNMVEAFIHKIIVYQDGNVKVILNSNQVQEYSLSVNDKGTRNSNKGSSFYTVEMDWYEFSRIQYEESVKGLMEEILVKHIDEVKLMLFSYSFIQKGGCKTFKQREYKIMVYVRKQYK